MRSVTFRCSLADNKAIQWAIMAGLARSVGDLMRKMVIEWFDNQDEIPKELIDGLHNEGLSGKRRGRRYDTSITLLDDIVDRDPPPCPEEPNNGQPDQGPVETERNQPQADTSATQQPRKELTPPTTAKRRAVAKGKKAKKTKKKAK